MQAASSPVRAWTPDALRRRDDLVKFIWDVDDLTSLVAQFAGTTMEHKLQVNDLLAPSADEREQLQLRDTTLRVLVREGVTRAAIHASAPLVFVSFHAVVAVHRVPEAARRALLLGEMGLGAVLRPYGLRRHEDVVQIVDDVDELGEQMLKVRGKLSLPGCGPVALVEETLYFSVLGRT